MAREIFTPAPQDALDRAISRTNRRSHAREIKIVIGAIAVTAIIGGTIIVSEPGLISRNTTTTDTSQKH